MATHGRFSPNSRFTVNDDLTAKAKGPNERDALEDINKKIDENAKEIIVLF
jgi:hypothetical protein